MAQEFQRGPSGPMVAAVARVLDLDFDTNMRTAQQSARVRPRVRCRPFLGPSDRRSEPWEEVVNAPGKCQKGHWILRPHWATRNGASIRPLGRVAIEVSSA